MVEEFDVVVLGGGPAGSVMSIRLAELGFRVGLIEHKRFPRQRVGESFSPSIVPLLKSVGLLSCLTETATLENETRMTHGFELDSQASSKSESFQVNRANFDQRLMDRSQSAGVRVLQPAKLVDSNFRSGKWNLDILSPEKSHPWTTRFLVDATGSNSQIRWGRNRYLAEPLFAIFAYWENRNSGFGMRIEAAESCWYWAAQVPPGLVNASVFIGEESLRLKRQGSLTDFYIARLKHSRLLKHLTDSRQITDVKIRNVTPRYRSTAVNSKICKVGEAAYVMDPVSSQGVQSAIASAVRAAVVVNTIFRKPERTEWAVDFYQSRIESSMAAHVKTSSEVYSVMGASHDNEFWKSRASSQNHPSSYDPTSYDWEPTEKLQFDDFVQLSASSELVEVGVIRDDFVDRGPGVRIHEKEIAFLNGIELGEFLPDLNEPRRISDLVCQWSRQLSPANCLQLVTSLGELQVIEKCNTVTTS